MEDRAGAQWAPDPFGRHELRYWDGSQWSEHVSDQGRTSSDAPLPAQRPRAVTTDPGTTHHPVIPLDGPVVGVGGGAVPRGLRDDVDALAAGRSRSRSHAAPLVVDAAAVSNALVDAPVGASGHAPVFDRAVDARRIPTSSAQAPVFDADLDDVSAHLAHGPQADGGQVPAGYPQPDASPFGTAGMARMARMGGLDDAPQTRAQARAAASLPTQHRPGAQDAEGPEVWDWRESKIPELLSGLAVVLLIALAAFLGGGSSEDAGPASQSVVSTPAAVPTIEGAQPTTRKKAPKAKISKAAPGRVVTTYRSTRPTTKRTTTTAANTTTRTKSPSATPPTSAPAPSDSSSSTTDPAPSDSPSDSAPSDSSSSTTTSKKSTTSTSASE